MKKILQINYTSENPHKTSVLREQNEKLSHNWGGGCAIYEIGNYYPEYIKLI